MFGGDDEDAMLHYSVRELLKDCSTLACKPERHEVAVPAADFAVCMFDDGSDTWLTDCCGVDAEPAASADQTGTCNAPSFSPSCSPLSCPSVSVSVPVTTLCAIRKQLRHAEKEYKSLCAQRDTHVSHLQSRIATQEKQLWQLLKRHFTLRQASRMLAHR